MINQMAWALIHAWMALSTRACGSMINSMGKGRLIGLIRVSLLEITKKARKMALEVINGQRAINTKASGKTT